MNEMLTKYAENSPNSAKGGSARFLTLDCRNVAIAMHVQHGRLAGSQGVVGSVPAKFQKFIA